MTDRPYPDPIHVGIHESQASLEARIGALASQAHPTRVVDGGYGRNRESAVCSLRPPATMTAGELRWEVRSDTLYLYTVGGELDLSGLQGELDLSDARGVEVAQLHYHGWPSHPVVFDPLWTEPRMPPGGSSSWPGHAPPLLMIDALGSLRQIRPASWRAAGTLGPRGRVAVNAKVPLG